MIELRGRIFLSARIRAGSRFKQFLCFVLIGVRCLLLPPVYAYPRLKTTMLDNPFSSGNITPNRLLTLMVHVDKSKHPSSAKAIVKARSVWIGVFSVGIFLCKRPART
jgi:hypothetical protein